MSVKVNGGQKTADALRQDTVFFMPCGGTQHLAHYALTVQLLLSLKACTLSSREAIAITVCPVSSDLDLFKKT